jgi:hypothetical protein
MTSMKCQPSQRMLDCVSRHRRVLAVGIGSGLLNGGSPMLKTLLAAVAIVGLIVAAFTSSRLAEGSGCTNCAVSEPFTLQPTTILVACLTSGC